MNFFPMDSRGRLFQPGWGWMTVFIIFLFACPNYIAQSDSILKAHDYGFPGREPVFWDGKYIANDGKVRSRHTFSCFFHNITCIIKSIRYKKMTL